jgi:hypothetical protein
MSRTAFDYGDLDAALRATEAAMRRTRSSLDQLASGGWVLQHGETDAGPSDEDADNDGK